MNWIESSDILEIDVYEKGFLRRKGIFLDCHMSQSEGRVMIVKTFTMPEGRTPFKLA